MNKLPPIEKKRSSILPPIMSRNKTEYDESKRSSLKNYDNAISFYSKKIISDQDNVMILIKRGICYWAKGYYYWALLDAWRTIEIDPSFLKGHYVASWAYLYMYEIEKAEQHIKNNNPRWTYLISTSKKDILSNCQKFKLYEKYIYFLKELYIRQAFFPKLEIRFYSDDHRGVLTKEAIKNNEVIMTIPKAILISLEVAWSTSYGVNIEEFMFQEWTSPKHCLLSAFLLFERRNEKWRFYFDLLPKDFTNFPIFYTVKELEYLKGSPFLDAVEEKKKDIKKDYHRWCTHLPEFTQFSFLEFCEARMLISSRIFGISIGNNKTDVWAPFADWLNHKRPRQTQWYFSDNLDSFVIQATEDISQGEEVFDSYGNKSNTRFWMNYGFALEDNDSCEYNIIVNLNKTFPLYDKKIKIFKTKREYIRRFRLHNIMAESQIVELLSFLRFCLFDGNINELYNEMNSNQLLFYEQDLLMSFYYISPISKNLEIKV